MKSFTIAIMALTALASATPISNALDDTCSGPSENCLQDSDCCSGSLCNLALEQCIFQGNPGQTCSTKGQQCQAFGATFPPCCDGLTCGAFSRTCDPQ
ncbi:hypothetical protein SAMD00023353_4500660 [Rosellinia necatrix]|uniref:Uncharacterized protein n=1 Tax=Rosellinia necatrix TaxID=77044 RepID=A0A1W2TPZ3_ROSNE|nr:hypothetical protein SAMD00023353_4500660 [Rosellinia necatrix]